MSFYYQYSKVSGEDAFLAGVVNTLCEETLGVICPKYYAIAIDVIKANSGNFCEMLKDRLHKYLLEESPEDRQAIEDLNFELIETENSACESIHNMIAIAKEEPYADERRYIDTFLKGVSYQLGKEKKVYIVKGELNKKIQDVISDFYTYIVLDIIFIEYEDYMVMIVFGSDE